MSRYFLVLFSFFFVSICSWAKVYKCTNAQVVLYSSAKQGDNCVEMPTESIEKKGEVSFSHGKARTPMAHPQVLREELKKEKMMVAEIRNGLRASNLSSEDTAAMNEQLSVHQSNIKMIQRELS